MVIFKNPSICQYVYPYICQYVKSVNMFLQNSESAKHVKPFFFSVWNYHDSVVSFLQCLSKPMQERGHFCLSLLAHTGPVTSVGFGTPFAITDTER